METCKRILRVGGSIGCGAAMLICVAGCASLRGSTGAGVTPGAKYTLSDEHAASREVADVQRDIEAGGDASSAIPRLLNVISRYPGSPAAVDARFWLGTAYYRIGSYPDATEQFNDYLRSAPNGKYAKACVERMNRVSAEYNKKSPSPEILDEQVKELTKQAQAKPDDLQAQLNLADALWKKGDFAGAGAAYYQIVKQHPEFQTDLTVRSRIEIEPDGQYVVLSPDEIQRRAIQDQPLSIINTNSFRSGPDIYSLQSRFYTVTGQVVNRSDSVLSGVQVTVTIYGFGATVFDTRTVNIGKMNPSEIRAFSVRFDNFDNIENVNRFECVPSFER